MADLYFFSSGEDLYKCYQANMAELLKAVLDFAKGYLDEGYMSESVMSSASFDFSRLTLNLLSMFKSFLDHGKAALTRRFGEDSHQLRSWEKAQNVEYDASSAYRLFNNLRNYAQHVGMPPLHFSLQESVEKEGVEIVLEFYRDELLSTYSRWSRDAKLDLVNGADRIFLLPNLDEWSRCFHRLVKIIQTIRRDEVFGSAELISQIRQVHKIPDHGEIILMPEPEASDDGEFDFGFKRLPEAKALEIMDGSFLKIFDEY
jgi:hypothetical protein